MAVVPNYQTQFEARSPYSGTRTTSQQERLAFGPLTPYDFPGAGGNVQAMLDAAATVNSAKRHPTCFIPPGDFTVGNLTISDVEGGSSLSRGNIIVEGAGQNNTKLICNAATGDALQVKSGKVQLSNFTLTSDGVNRGVTLGNGASRAPTAVIGAGNGISIDPGVLPASSDIANCRFDNISVDSQPEHNFNLLGPELGLFTNLVSIYAGKDGFHIDGTNSGGSVLGISSTFHACRAIWCRGRAWTDILTTGYIYQNCQSLQCDGVNTDGLGAGYHVYSNAGGSLWLNHDLEGDFDGSMTLNLIGAIFGGSGVQVIGGIAHGFHTCAYKFAGAGQRIIGTRIFNTTAEVAVYPMANAVDAASATKFFADLAPSINVTAPFTPVVPAATNVYRAEGLLKGIEAQSDSTLTSSLERNSTDATSASLVTKKSRGTNASKSVVAQNDILKTQSAQGYDGAAYRAAANEYVLVIAATPSATDMQGRWRVDVAPAGSVIPSEGPSYDHTAGLRIAANTVIDPNRLIVFRPYTVGTLPAASGNAGKGIYVSDGTANKRFAISDGTNWRWPDGAIVS